jgi:hypothetical protein
LIDEPSDVFDYSELEKYGFGKLVTPIMEAGGRLAMYKLLDMPVPPMRRKPKQLSVQKVVIDKVGESDCGRYTGLKMGLLDDSAMAEALQQAQRKQEEGISLRPQIEEELYVAPYKAKRNVGPKLTPDWTAERIDDELSRQGDAVSWARRARDERIVTDRAESLELGNVQQAYSLLTASLGAASFGKSTPIFLTMAGVLGSQEQIQGMLDVLRIPSLGLFLASVASSVLCSKQAVEKRRNSIVWTLKGLLGGPLTLRELQQLPELRTRQEIEDLMRNNDKSKV